MDEVINKTDELIDKLMDSDFVKEMKHNKEVILKNNLINNSDVRELYKNEYIHSYIENQNVLDYHLYYLNKELSNLINKGCSDI